MLKQMIKAVCCIFFCTSLFASTSLPAPAQSVQVLDQVIATVNGKPVTQNQFDTFYARTVAQLKEIHHQLPPKSRLVPILFEQYLNRVMLLQLAKQYGVKVTDEQIKQQIARVAKQGKMTIAQLKQKAYQQGYSYPEFKQEVREEIAIGTLQREAVGGKVHVSQDKIDKTYAQLSKNPVFSKQYHVIDILIPLPSSPTKAQLARAQSTAAEMIKHLRAGEDYKKVADKDDTDLGWRTLSDLPTIFEGPVSSMKVGEVAGPIAAGNGLHVIKLLSIRNSKLSMPTKDHVERLLFEKQFQQKSKDWIAKIRKTADVQILVPQY